MPADGVIQIPPASTGLKVDTSELTRADGTVIERQRIVLGDPAQPTSLAVVTTGGELAVFLRSEQLNDVVGQLKRVAMLLEILTRQRVTLADVE